MKKFVLGLGVCLLFAGCGGGNKVVCSMSSDPDTDGIDATMEITANFKDDKVSELSAEMIFKDKDTAEAWCSLMSLSDEAKDLYECKGKSIIIKDFTKADGAAYKDLTKANFKKELEEAGYKCK